MSQRLTTAAKTAKHTRQRGFSIMEVVVSSVILTAGAMTALGITNMSIGSLGQSRDVGRGATLARQEIERQRAIGEPEAINTTVAGYRIITTVQRCGWNTTTLECNGAGNAAWEITVNVQGGIRNEQITLRTLRYNGDAT